MSKIVDKPIIADKLTIADKSTMLNAARIVDKPTIVDISGKKGATIEIVLSDPALVPKFEALVDKIMQTVRMDLCVACVYKQNKNATDRIVLEF